MAAATTSAVPAGSTEPAPVAAGAPVRVMAIGLWAVVGSLLCYGITMTAIKAAALFS